ncbi:MULTISPECIES: glycoside hydrolase family 28 protein [unclassified Brenneria]|uniref:glycoside hydrolase family 28 protein n=1 Tax=unclassified Brenneria TaxID=2634434 RepID=UPI0015530D23|nr:MULTISPECIES: glycosyl hydrolase family 28 protein [unclassified Brenneria]MBJ7221869.1 endopolygalacturonase [Brenneria sp. L3-3C-1]MEE3643112.1 glycosyl hydrolase family 28 protein [Brenneria sp. L3_3C_1]MEE3650701.1 glycosyl hydrolase family 28 protein [Brenneria sp. HEZEL_4_2_4]NPD00656.1 endopolygalacturonase [Brenneria sp. hezel4-2-4]
MEYKLDGISLSLFFGFIGMASFSSHAADTRVVKMPTTPAACAVLQSQGSIATKDIQKALNSCSQGKAVKLAAGGKSAVFLSGSITIPSGVSLWIDKGVTLRAVNNAAAFNAGSGTCGTLDNSGKGCLPLIKVNAAQNSGIYGPGTIDGQGGVALQDKKVSWWALAASAKVKKMKQNAPRLIQINKSKNFTLYNVTLTNSPNFHVVFSDSDGLTAWKTTIKTPATARNTDGIDPISSQNITIAYSNISTGDDNVAIKAYSGRASAQNISIIHNQFGSGHGMSIGSETMGVYGVLVDDLIMNGTTNGLRIKSDKSAAGIVNGVTYKNVTMTNVAKPIVIDTVYEQKSGNTVPDWSGITFTNVTSKTSGVVVINGENAKKPIVVTMKNVTLTTDTKWQVKNAKVNKI